MQGEKTNFLVPSAASRTHCWHAPFLNRELSINSRDKIKADKKACVANSEPVRVDRSLVFLRTGIDRTCHCVELVATGREPEKKVDAFCRARNAIIFDTEEHRWFYIGARVSAVSDEGFVRTAVIQSMAMTACSRKAFFPLHPTGQLRPDVPACLSCLQPCIVSCTLHFPWLSIICPIIRMRKIFIWYYCCWTHMTKNHFQTWIVRLSIFQNELAGMPANAKYRLKTSECLYLFKLEAEILRFFIGQPACANLAW